MSVIFASRNTYIKTFDDNAVADIRGQLITDDGLYTLALCTFMSRTNNVRWTAVVALLCAGHATAPPAVDGAIRVLAFPARTSETAVVPREDDERRPEAPDMLACLMAMSYTCVQRKTLVYLDALNRLHRIPLLGEFVTAVRTRPVDDRTPAINERLLDARGFNDVLSLSVLVDSVVRSIVKDHALKITFPKIAGLTAVGPTDSATTETSEDDEAAL